jgi:putative oxidoreductase
VNDITFPDLTDAIVQLRIICGLLFIPHILAQFTAKEAVFGFFEAAGLKPAFIFVRLALVVQTLVLLGLVLGIYVFYAAWLGGIFMISAGLAAFKVSGGRWVWNLGGCEFHILWGVCCIIVALHSPA